MADKEACTSDSSPSSSREGSPLPSFRPRTQSSLDLAKEEIICPMCISVFDTPRSLQCLHSYCERCIESLLKSSPNKTSICCPECRADTVITPEGVKGLPMNFKLKRFVELLSKKEKLDILSRSVSMKQSRRPAITSPTKQKSLSQESQTCALHKDKVLEYYCEECKVLICGKCMLEVHRLHDGVKYASEVIFEHISVMLAHVMKASTTLSVSQKVLDSLSSNTISVKNAGKEAEASVKSYFENIHQLLRDREAAILDEIRRNVNKKEKIIRRQQQEIQESSKELQKSIKMVQDVKESRAEDMSLLLEEESLIAQVDENKERLDMILANIKIKGNQTFTSPFHPDCYFESQCKIVGESPYQNPQGIELDDPESADIVPPLPPNSRPRQQRSTLPNLMPSLSTDSICSIDSSVVNFSLRNGSITSFTSERDRRSGSYDNDVFGSESSPIILPPCLEINPKQLLGSSPRMATVYPNGVCIGNPDSLIVMDSRNGILRILTPTGKCLESIVLESKGDGNLVEPTAVATNEEGIIYVIIKGTSYKIQKYSPNGVFQSKLKVRGHLGDPTGITVLPNGSVLVTDSQKSCIHQFDASGKYQGKLDIMESKKPDNPSDITHDHRGNLIVTDCGNNCIWIYTSNGRFVNRFGKQGSNPGELLHPYSVTVDLDGYIYVAESGNHRISVFNLSGKFLRCFGKMGSEPGMFHYPRHLCVDSQGRLVVADEHNQRLQIFDIKPLVSGM